MQNFRRESAKKLRELIEKLSNLSKPILGNVIDYDEATKTYTVQPCDNEPLITNVVSFDPNTNAEIGAYVLCQSPDGQNWFITDINSWKNIELDATEGIEILSQNRINIEGVGIRLKGNGVELKDILLGMLDYIEAVNQSISTATPTIAQPAVTVTVGTPGIPYAGPDKANLTSNINTFNT